MPINLPTETPEIFDVLTKGNFISADSKVPAHKDLFRAIDENNNYEVLLDYFSHIGFQLIKGNSFYYFSKTETNKRLEDKLKSAYKWIDILDFFASYGESVDKFFSVGEIFSANDIFTQCKVNHALMEKLNGIKITKNIEKPLDKIQKLIDELVKATFAESYNEFHEEYKILAAYNYLEELIKTINIEDEETSE
jgi:hypothetical protein